MMFLNKNTFIVSVCALVFFLSATMGVHAQNGRTGSCSSASGLTLPFTEQVDTNNTSQVHAFNTNCQCLGGTVTKKVVPRSSYEEWTCNSTPSTVQNPSGQVQNPGPSPACEPGKLCNPLGTTSTIPELIFKIIDVLLVFLVPIIILYIMYAGFLFVTAQGNAEGVTKARNALLYAVIGGVIVLGAKLIIDILQGTIDALK